MIELIMVIVILGVLSAFALPRFADLGGSARKAAMEGVAGSIRSSMGIARAQVFASGIDSNAATGTIVLDDTEVILVFGYPSGISATAPGILAAAGLPLGDVGDTTDNFTNGDYTYINNAGVLEIYPTARTACKITYTQAADADTPPVLDSSAVTLANCE